MGGLGEKCSRALCVQPVAAFGEGKLCLDHYRETVASPQTREADPVNHPPHYVLNGIEVIDAIEAWGLGFCLGNTVKYVARAGKKNPATTVEDLKKARWYLDREIARLGGKP